VPGVPVQPVDLDVADRHPLGLRGPAGEPDAQRPADAAAAAVAADQVLRGDLLVSHGGGHAVRVLREVAELGSQLHGDPEVRQSLPQDLLHPPLRDQQSGRVRRVRRGNLAGLRVRLGDHLRAAVLAKDDVGGAGRQHPVDHPEVVEHLEAARREPLAPGTVRERVHPVHDPDRYAPPGQVACQRQPGRAGTHHQHAGPRHDDH
jgi:hypothetical protein